MDREVARLKKGVDFENCDLTEIYYFTLETDIDENIATPTCQIADSNTGITEEEGI